MRGSAEAITDFGQRMQAGPIVGVLLVGTMVSGCALFNEEEPVVHETEQGATCIINTMSYDAEQDILNMEVSARNTRGPIEPLGYIATSVMAEKPVEDYGRTGLIVDIEREYSTVNGNDSISIPFEFEEDVNNWYRVLLAVDTKDGQPQYCDDKDFVFKQEDGELAVAPTDEVIVCNRSQGRLMITSADLADPSKYPRYPWTTDDSSDGCT